MHIQANSKLLFIGDSITDCGRKRPIGEGGFDQALGDGYVSFIDAALTAAYPEYAVRTFNMGVSGNTVRDLKDRWQRDVLEQNPDWLAIMIGINDVWQHFGLPMHEEYLISPQEYERTLRELILQVRGDLNGLILMTPYILEQNREEPMRALMDRFGAIVCDLADENRALLVDTQATFDRVLPALAAIHLAPDRIHVNRAGHMILARATLQSIGFDWERLLISTEDA